MDNYSDLLDVSYYDFHVDCVIIMSDETTRLRRAQKLKRRNLVHKEMRENTGAFAIKVIDPRKEEYKRIKLNPREVIVDEEDT